MPVPANPKIYHIVHVDKLASIIEMDALLCDAEIARRGDIGTTIGMGNIKRRRLEQLSLQSRPSLRVGGCVSFYYCPRSIMLYVIHQANHPELAYRGGQDPIIHLEADLRQTVQWAQGEGRRWAFTSSNAGSSYFEDYCDLNHLNEIDWQAVDARNWAGCKERKQAEFLVEHSFPWHLVTRIGVQSSVVHGQVRQQVQLAAHRPAVEIKPDWYY